MARGKDSATAPSRRKRAYELDGMVPLAFPQDPIRSIENEVLRDLSEEYRVLRLEQMIEKRRRQVSQMRDGIADGGTLPSNTDFLNMAKFMAELSPEEAQRVRSAYTFLKLADKGGGGGMSYLPMLLNYAKANPGASENQMINYLKLMDSQLLKGLEIAKAMNPNPAKSESEMVNYLKLMDSQLMKGLEIAKAVNPNPAKAETNAMEFIKLMKDLVVEGVRNPLLQALKDSQPQPGFLDQLITKPELLTRFKEIGLFGSSNVATSQFDLEIEKLRGERQMEATKWQREMHREDLQRQTEDRRTDTLISIFGPIAAAAIGPASQKMQQLGQQAAAHNPTSRMQPSEVTPTGPPRSPKNQVLIKCSCGHQGVETFQGAPPASFNCPQCGQILLVGDSYLAGKPEERDTGNRS